ncbi:hypothetical protein [Kitasatospora sp. NBC_01266]|uniref:hypothetical protein n=1 Tax=Kitasatospora sp. NBC_01266 TaxID=2903572 RepID=UPI002E37AC02|nr:hypothetical protein [Kitasatospora sp. NBC_01266]
MLLKSLPTLPKHRTDLVTRRMCATAHLDPRLAREVLADYAEDGMEALGPPVGINLIALVRHSRLVESRVHSQDRVLAWLLTALLALVTLAVAQVADRRPIVASLALGAVLLILVAAFAVVYRALWASWSIVLALSTQDDSALTLAPPVAAEVEQHLASFKRLNMVVYHHSVEKVNPFVGSGWRISESVWNPLNIGRPAKDANGAALVPLPFDAADLHQHVAKQISKATGLESLTARNRLYVRGFFVSHIPDALPDPTKRPAAVIPSDWVKAGAARPTKGMETYLCLRVIGEGGHVVVSMHLRAQLHHPTLTWEVNSYVLPPLGDRFGLPQRLLAGPVRLRLRAAHDALRQTRPLLFGSPGRLLGRASTRARTARALEKQRREIRKGYATFDFGATNSLRERAASWEKMGFAERRDSATFVKLLTQAVLVSTRDFLTAHHIDTTDLDDQQQQIIQQQTTIFNGSIGNAVIGGTGNTQNNQQGPVAPPGGGSSSGQPSAGGSPAAP